jgi:hypothetical protein
VSSTSQECRKTTSRIESRLQKGIERESAGSQLRSERLATEAANSLGTQRKGNVHCWKPLPSGTEKTMAENICLCVIVHCKVL